jgi:hypothetical protein
MIGVLKKQFRRSFKGKKYSHEEMGTILQEAAQIVNNRPLARQGKVRYAKCPI